MIHFNYVAHTICVSLCLKYIKVVPLPLCNTKYINHNIENMLLIYWVL